MRRVRGFTLIEACLTIIIIGVGVLSMLELMATGTRSHADSASRVSGLTISKCLRERTLGWTYAQLLAQSGQSYSPPIDAGGAALVAFDDWQQTLQVQAVERDNLAKTVSTATPVAVRVTVHAVRNGHRMSSLTWYRFAPSE